MRERERKKREREAQTLDSYEHRGLAMLLKPKLKHLRCVTVSAFSFVGNPIAEELYKEISQRARDGCAINFLQYDDLSFKLCFVGSAYARKD
jgi:hypothetical protein